MQPLDTLQLRCFSVTARRGNVVADGAADLAPSRHSGAQRRYAAFISYSHRDDEIGEWLQKRLESYQVPSALVGREGPAGPVGKRLGKAFRDRADLSAAHDLGAEIRAALETADALIVLCSPRSCGSKYVHEEIRTFKVLGKGTRIFAAIVDGEPHAAGKPGRTAADECFPPALIYRLGPDGAISTLPEPNEPIAADFRDDKDGRENGALKLIAGLLGVPLDELVQREKQAERRRRLRANAVAAAMAVLALGAVGAGAFALVQRNEAVAQRQEAVGQRQKAEKNASEREEQRALAARNEKTARANEDRALAEALRATTAEGVATTERDNARRTLHSIFTARAWENIDRGNLNVGAQYALAGWRLSRDSNDDANTATYRMALAAAMFRNGDSFPPLLSSGQLQGYPIFSSDGALMAMRTLDEVRVWRASDASFVFVAKAYPGKYTEGQIGEFSFSPSGRYLVATDGAATLGNQAGDWVRIWDTRNGHLVSQLRDEKLWTFGHAFSADETQVITCASRVGLDPQQPYHSTPALAVWSVATGQILNETHLTFETTPCNSDRNSMVWYSDAGTLFAHRDEYARIANAQGATKAIGWSNVKFVSSDAQRILTSVESPEPSFKVFSARAGALVGQWTFAEVGLPIEFSQRGKFVLTVTGDGGWALISVDDHRVVKRGRFSPQAGPTAPTPDAVRMYVAQNRLSGGFLRDEAIMMLTDPSGWRLHNSTDGEMLVNLPYNAVSAAAPGEASFSSDGRSILSGFLEGAYASRLRFTEWGLESLGAGRSGLVTPKGDRVFDRNYPYSPRLMPFAGPRIVIEAELPTFDRGMSFEAANDAFLGRSKQTLVVVNAHTGASLANLPVALDASAKFSPDGGSIVTTDRETVRYWTANGRELWRHTADERKQYSRSYASPMFSPDGKKIITVSNPDVVIWSTAGKIMQTLPHKGRVKSAQFSTDGSRLVAVQNEQGSSWTPDKLVIWDVAGNKQIAQVGDFPKGIEAISVSPKAPHVAAAGFGGELQIWNLATGGLVKQLGNWGCAKDIKYSPSGETIAVAVGCGSGDGRLILLNAASGELIGNFAATTQEVDFSPNGELVATFGLGNGVRLFSVRQGREVANLGGFVQYGKFSRDGRHLVTADVSQNAMLSKRTNLRIWNIERLNQDVDVLARDACLNFLGPVLRRFDKSVYEADQLLISVWKNANRDICEGVSGVDSIVDIYRRAGVEDRAVN